ncbi:unnamed protein product, partial [Amoebophrya sp. A25]|eukprot:GSA25T00015147001.1
MAQHNDWSSEYVSFHPGSVYQNPAGAPTSAVDPAALQQAHYHVVARTHRPEFAQSGACGMPGPAVIGGIVHHAGSAMQPVGIVQQAGGLGPQQVRATYAAPLNHPQPHQHAFVTSAGTALPANHQSVQHQSAHHQSVQQGHTVVLTSSAPAGAAPLMARGHSMQQCATVGAATGSGMCPAVIRGMVSSSNQPVHTSPVVPVGPPVLSGQAPVAGRVIVAPVM